MSKKYVIEIKPEYEDSFKGLMILGAKDSNLFVDTLAVEELEELNSDYINEHFSDLQDTAYQRGLEDGQNQNEAWKYARKIACVPQNGGMDRAWLDAIFGSALDRSEILFTFSAKNAIERIKAYEKKQADKIEVGDEVIYNGTTKCIVVRPEDDERYASLIDSDGTHYSADHRECEKTGRHFDIDKILEEMKA